MIFNKIKWVSRYLPLVLVTSALLAACGGENSVSSTTSSIGQELISSTTALRANTAAVPSVDTMRLMPTNTPTEVTQPVAGQSLFIQALGANFAGASFAYTGMTCGMTGRISNDTNMYSFCTISSSAQTISFSVMSGGSVIATKSYTLGNPVIVVPTLRVDSLKLLSVSTGQEVSQPTAGQIVNVQALGSGLSNTYFSVSGLVCSSTNKIGDTNMYAQCTVNSGVSSVSAMVMNGNSAVASKTYTVATTIVVPVVPRVDSLKLMPLSGSTEITQPSTGQTLSLQAQGANFANASFSVSGMTCDTTNKSSDGSSMYAQCTVNSATSLVYVFVLNSGSILSSKSYNVTLPVVTNSPRVDVLKLMPMNTAIEVTQPKAGDTLFVQALGANFANASFSVIGMTCGGTGKISDNTNMYSLCTISSTASSITVSVMNGGTTVSTRSYTLSTAVVVPATPRVDSLRLTPLSGGADITQPVVGQSLYVQVLGANFANASISASGMTCGYTNKSSDGTYMYTQCNVGSSVSSATVSVMNGGTTVSSKTYTVSGAVLTPVSRVDSLKLLPLSGSTEITQPSVGQTLYIQALGASLTNASFSVVGMSCGSTSKISGDTNMYATCTVNSGVSYVSVAVMNAATTLASKAYTVPQTSVSTGTKPVESTGITSADCIAAGKTSTPVGSSTLVNCASSAAQSLSTAQNGMLNSTAQSFSVVGAYPLTDCVKDNVTGLIWEGKTASGLRAGNNIYTHIRYPNSPPNPSQNAENYASYVNSIRLCGYSDWRLPTIDELYMLLNFKKSIDPINWGAAVLDASMYDTSWFPNAAGRVHWSSNFNSGNAVFVDTSNAYIAQVDTLYGAPNYPTAVIRLVRGTANTWVSTSRYTIKSDTSEVFDTQTGLTWKRCAAGMTWNGSTCTGSYRAMNMSEIFAYANANSGWRLPTAKELVTLINTDETNGRSISGYAFPNLASATLCSSTPSGRLGIMSSLPYETSTVGVRSYMTTSSGCLFSTSNAGTMFVQTAILVRN